MFADRDYKIIDRAGVLERGGGDGGTRGGGTPMRSVSFYWRCSSRRERAILRIRDYAA